MICCEECQWEGVTHRFLVSMAGWSPKTQRVEFKGFIWLETCRECALSYANGGHAYGNLPRRLEETTEEAFRMTRRAGLVMRYARRLGNRTRRMVM